MPSNRCKNCNAELIGEYCAECGQKKKDVNISIFALWAILSKWFDEGWNGLPSYKTMVLPKESAETNQFHIIQPQVV